MAICFLKLFLLSRKPVSKSVGLFRKFQNVLPRTSLNCLHGLILTMVILYMAKCTWPLNLESYQNNTFGILFLLFNIMEPIFSIRRSSFLCLHHSGECCEDIETNLFFFYVVLSFRRMLQVFQTGLSLQESDDLR